MSLRTQRMASVLHRAVQSVLSEGLADPRVSGVVTVTGVKVSDDLSQAVVMISVLPEKNQSKVIHALADAAGYIRREASERVAIHRPPKLLFRLDRAFKKQAEVLDALARLRLDDPGPEGGAGDEPPTIEETPTPRTTEHPE